MLDGVLARTPLLGKHDSNQRYHLVNYVFHVLSRQTALESDSNDSTQYMKRQQRKGNRNKNNIFDQPSKATQVQADTPENNNNNKNYQANNLELLVSTMTETCVPLAAPPATTTTTTTNTTEPPSDSSSSSSSSVLARWCSACLGACIYSNSKGRTSCDMAGLAWTIQGLVVVLMCLLPVRGNPVDWYPPCTILAGLWQVCMAVWLTRALFHQAALAADDQDESNKEAGTKPHKPTTTTTTNKRQQLVQPSASRIYEYNEIQAKKWSNVFVRMRDATEEEDDDLKPNKNTASDPQTTTVPTRPAHSGGARRSLFVLGTALPVSLQVLGTCTLLITSWLWWYSYRRITKVPQTYGWTSISRWTSTRDWFRTWFLLSYGCLATLLILYTIPTLVLVVQQGQYWGHRLVQAVRSSWTGSSQTTTTSSTNGVIELPNHSLPPQEPLVSENHEAGTVSKQTPATTENESSASSYTPPQPLVQGSPDVPPTATAVAPVSAPRPAAPPIRTSRQATVSTKVVASVIAAAGLGLGIVCAHAWSQTSQRLQPLASSSAFQGNAWVTGYEVVQADDGNDPNDVQNQVWCPNAPQATTTNNNGDVTVVVSSNGMDDKDDESSYIAVQVSVAWGGDWACPNQPDSYCQDTMTTHVSCVLATQPLVYQQEQAQNDDQQAVQFVTVYDYLNYRFQNANPGQNDDGGGGVDFSYNADQAPSSGYYNDDANANDDNNHDGMVVSWNRQSEFIIGDCRTCVAESPRTLLDDAMVPLAQEVHGVWTSLGLLGTSLAWLLLGLPLAKQKQQRQQTSPDWAWKTLQ